MYRLGTKSKSIKGTDANLIGQLCQIVLLLYEKGCALKGKKDLLTSEQIKVFSFTEYTPF